MIDLLEKHLPSPRAAIKLKRYWTFKVLSFNNLFKSVILLFFFLFLFKNVNSYVGFEILIECIIELKNELINHHYHLTFSLLAVLHDFLNNLIRTRLVFMVFTLLTQLMLGEWLAQQFDQGTVWRELFLNL